MNIQEIIMADATGIILMLTLTISRYITRRKRQLEDKFFTGLVIIGLCGAFFELVSFLVDGKPGFFFKFMNYASNTLIYSCTATISVAWLWYADSIITRNPKRIRTIFLPFLIIWGALIILLIVNLFTGILFTISKDNLYGRAPAGYIYYGFLFASFIASIIVYIYSRIKHGKTIFFPIHMFLIPVIISCVLQALWYGIAAAWLGCAVGLTGIFINILSRYSLIDGLTHLSNRTYLENSLQTAKSKSNKYAYAGIMTDIDRFKSINDTYGHSIGDQALRDASNILTNSIGRNTLAFRFAGDEFVILVKVPIDKNEKLESVVENIENAIRENSKKYNENGDGRFQINFSIGHSFYDANKPVDEFFRQMDLAMYKEKKVHHQDQK